MNDFDSQSAWNASYERGDHARMWDCPWPSPELVGFIAASDMQAGQQVIDLGCGTGSDAVYLARQGLSVVGVDVSDVALDLAQRRSTAASVEVTWMRADVRSLPLTDQSADLITDRGCLHHLPDADRAAYSEEMARLLAPGGRLFIRGMSAEGRKKYPVNAASLGRHFDNDHFRLLYSTPFEMVGPNGTAEATLAVIHRR